MAADHEPDAPKASDASEDNLLDRVEDLVDDVWDPDQPPAEPEGPWERRSRLMDSWTAILLAVAAVATTWASFQASQWGEAQTDAQSASAMARSDAGRAAAEATSDQIIDSQMWLSWLQAVSSGREQQASFFRERFSPSLSAAQEQWLASARVQVDRDGFPVDEPPPGTPLDLPGYIVPAKVAAADLAATAEAALMEADEASNTATEYVLLAVLFALSLFFGSIATKFTQPKLQVLLAIAAMAVLAIGVVRMLLLPQLF